MVVATKLDLSLKLYHDSTLVQKYLHADVDRYCWLVLARLRAFGKRASQSVTPAQSKQVPPVNKLFWILEGARLRWITSWRHRHKFGCQSHSACKSNKGTFYLFCDWLYKRKWRGRGATLLGERRGNRYHGWQVAQCTRNSLFPRNPSPSPLSRAGRPVA